MPREEFFRCGKTMVSGPPPTGQQIDLILPEGSVTAARIEERQTRLLEPGKVLEHLLWPPAAPVAGTAGFRQQRHDPLAARLRGILETSLFERPRLSILQSLQDRGCDLLIEWPLRAKYGVQLKSNGDVEEEGFANKTLAQIQDSRQHGLESLFVLLAADITEQPTSKKRRGRANSNVQKVQGLVSRISAMNDPYVVVVPPERVWNLLLPE